MGISVYMVSGRFMSLKLLNRLLLQPCVLNQPKNLLFLGEESCFLILLLFAQVIGFAVSHQNGSGSKNEWTYPTRTSNIRIYFLDPKGGLGWDPG